MHHALATFKSEVQHDAARKIYLALACVELFLHTPIKSGLMITCVEPRKIKRWSKKTLDKVILQDTSYFCVGTKLYEKAQTLVDALNLLQNPAIFRNAMGVCADESISPLITREEQTHFTKTEELLRHAQGMCGDYALAVTEFIKANTPHRNKVFMDDVFGPEAP